MFTSLYFLVPTTRFYSFKMKNTNLQVVDHDAVLDIVRLQIDLYILKTEEWYTDVYIFLRFGGSLPEIQLQKEKKP